MSLYVYVYICSLALIVQALPSLGLSQLVYLYQDIISRYTRGWKRKEGTQVCEELLNARGNRGFCQQAHSRDRYIRDKREALDTKFHVNSYAGSESFCGSSNLCILFLLNICSRVFFFLLILPKNIAPINPQILQLNQIEIMIDSINVA